ANRLRAGRAPDGGRSIHEHEAVCRVIEPMVGVDQLDAPALQSAELLCRRLQVIEGARAVSPSAPDYSAADEYMGWAPHRGGAAAAPQLQKHAAANLRDNAAVLKEAKKVKEEQKLRRGPKGGGGKGGPAHAPSPAAKHVRSRAEIPEVDAAAPAAETVLDPTGKECVLDYESRKMKTPDEWSRALDSDPPITTYMDEVLKNDHAAYHPFISDLARANTLGLTCRPKAVPLAAAPADGDTSCPQNIDVIGADPVRCNSILNAMCTQRKRHVLQFRRLLPLVAADFRLPWGPVVTACDACRAVSRLGPAARKRPAVGRSLARKDFLECRPFIGASRAERSARRQETSGPCHLLGPDERGFLEWNAVAPQTQRNYQEALAEFQSSAAARSLPLATAADADLALTNCADFAWGTGLERAVLLKTYAALISERPDIPRKGSLRLPRFSRAPQGWERLDPGQTRPPIPWQVTALLASAISTSRPRSGSRKHCGSNLRPSVRGGLADESILLDSVEVPWLGPLAARCRTAAPTMLPFGSNAQELGRPWRRALQLVRPGRRCAPYQLRRGGPSHDRLCRHWSLAEIKGRGRWASDYSMKRHEAHALLQQELAELDAATREQADAAPDRLHKVPETASQGWDIADGCGADLRSPDIIDTLLSRVQSGAIMGAHVGLDCKTRSRARKLDGRGPPPLRSDGDIWGLPSASRCDAGLRSIASHAKEE
ncbi:unnamed protein product, partial [Prorocentrum cordatum]